MSAQAASAEQSATTAPPVPGEEVTAGEIMKRVGGATIVNRTTFDLVMSDDEIRRTWRTAAALAQSGMFKDAMQAEQAFAKILIGRDLGISPTQALMTIDLVKGSIQLRGVLLAGFLRDHPDYDYRLPEGHPTETECTVIIERRRDGAWSDVGSWTFTEAAAVKAGLLPAEDKRAAWNAHRPNMLMWRAMANAVRAHAPNLFRGVPVYVEGEIPREPELTSGVGDGQVQGLDLGPKVEAVLDRARELGHVGLSDRATAEMVLAGKSPRDVERWAAEAGAELDKLAEAKGEEEIADADVVDEPPPEPEPEPEHVLADREHVGGRRYVMRCSCGAQSEPVTARGAVTWGEEHLAAREVEPEEAPVPEDPVEAANRAQTLRDEGNLLLDAADDAQALGRDEEAKGLRERGQALITEANAISNTEQPTLGI